MGAYLNQQTAFSHPLWPVVTYSHTLAHKYTPSLAEASDIHSHTGRHPLSFENPQSPFTLQNPHTPRPVCLGTLHQRTHAPAYTDTHTHTHTDLGAHTSQRAPRLIASPFDWWHLFHTFCRWLTKICSELVALRGRAMQVSSSPVEIVCDDLRFKQTCTNPSTHLLNQSADPELWGGGGSQVTSITGHW